jgi:membrane-associated phospholipid phosphatase
VGAGLAALGVGALSSQGRGMGLDRTLYRLANRDRGPLADLSLLGLTELGSIWASAGAAAVLVRAGRRREAVDALGAAGLMWAVGQGLKKAWRRPRPYEALEDVRLLIHPPRGTSWPSSHPAVLLSFVTVASRDLGLSRSARASLVALAGLVGCSRPYLGVHFPADVVGGLLLGRGVADLWSSVVSPRLVGGAPTRVVPGTVAR